MKTASMYKCEYCENMFTSINVCREHELTCMSNPSNIEIGDGQHLCPIHKRKLYRMYGCGYDYDRLLCPEIGCQHEIELSESTYYEGYGNDYKNKGEKK